MLQIKENAVTYLPAQGSWPESVHKWEKIAIQAVNTALTARRPLLIRGEPGTGKSQLARAAARELGRVFISEVINVKSESRDLQFHFDAVRRLGEAQALGAASADAGDRLDPIRFLSPGPLWWCLNWDTAVKQAEKSICGVADPVPPEGWDMSKGSVLLLDEIDKADADLPNGLLETLGNGGFSVPYTRHTVCLAENVPSPLVIITTNEERELPAAFLRRCMVLHISLPTRKDEFIEFLAERGRIHFPDDHSDAVRQEAARQLWNDRKDALDACQPPPGQADLIRLLRSGGAGCLDESAPLFGYTREKKTIMPKVKPTGQTIAGSADPPQQGTHVFLEPRGEMKFWCPVKFENKDPDDIRIQAPEWAQKGDTLCLEDARAKEAFRAPVYFPLEKTSRIWPFIKSVLGTLAATVDPDMEKVVPLAARLSPMNRLPMETRLTWHARGCVVLDFHDRLMPF